MFIDIRTLTVWQPHATLIALGEKKIETRSWMPGDVVLPVWLGIHAGRENKKYLRDLLNMMPLSYVFNKHRLSWKDLPLGYLIALVELVELRPTAYYRERIQGQELEFGDYMDGRVGWKFGRVVKLDTPIQLTGKQGLWTATVEVECCPVCKQANVATTGEYPCKLCGPIAPVAE